MVKYQVGVMRKRSKKAPWGRGVITKSKVKKLLQFGIRICQLEK